MATLKNPKHERFAQELAKGRTADEAYVEAGYRPNRGNAARMKANESIARRLGELQERGAMRVEFDLAAAARQLDEDRALAHEKGQAGAAVSATMAKAKLFGLVVEKAELNAALRMTYEDCLRELEDGPR